MSRRILGNSSQNAVSRGSYSEGIMTTSLLRPRFGLLPWIVGTAALVAIALGLFQRTAAFSQTNAAPDGTPVVLELFTSQGRSSCPPADALLSELGSSSKGVIPLAYHVDYWNHLGWSDPFSSRQFSERQDEYARAMNLGGDYTPQMVIGGDSQCVGSDRRSIARAISVEHSSSAPGHVSLHTTLGTGSPRTLQVKVKALMERTTADGPFVVMVAIFENGLITKIGGGENGGREITYDYTVRKLLPAFDLEVAEAPSVEKEVAIDLDPSWSVDHLGAAAFIQSTSSLRILGSAAEYPITKD